MTYFLFALLTNPSLGNLNLKGNQRKWKENHHTVRLAGWQAEATKKIKPNKNKMKKKKKQIHVISKTTIVRIKENFYLFHLCDNLYFSIARFM